MPRSLREFQSTHPARGATRPRPHGRSWSEAISIHAPRKGCDRGQRRDAVSQNLFQSTHPARGATSCPGLSSPPRPHFNPRTPQGVRLQGFCVHTHTKAISIHAPRKGCDAAFIVFVFKPSAFQSTHPARGATFLEISRAFACLHFNPRTPQGVRLTFTAIRIKRSVFQSTHPARGATARVQHLITRCFISIHAPRKGCDSSCPQAAEERLRKISIHAPRKGCDVALRQRHFVVLVISIHAPRKGCDFLRRRRVRQRVEFQSTHPARGATNRFSDRWLKVEISIHAPRKGCDTGSTTGRWQSWHFNPRTPQGVRRSSARSNVPSALISIHAPRKGCDLCRLCPFLFEQRISIHAPRKGCDRLSDRLRNTQRDFNPRTPQGVRHVAGRYPMQHGNDFNPRTPQGVRRQ